MRDLPTIPLPTSISALAAAGPESIGYIIIAIGLIGLGLGLVMLRLVSRRHRG